MACRFNVVCLILGHVGYQTQTQYPVGYRLKAFVWVLKGQSVISTAEQCTPLQSVAFTIESTALLYTNPTIDHEDKDPPPGSSRDCLQATSPTDSTNDELEDAVDCQPNSPAIYLSDNSLKTQSTDEITSQTTDSANPTPDNDSQIESNSPPPSATSLPAISNTSTFTSPPSSTYECQKTQTRTQDTTRRKNPGE